MMSRCLLLYVLAASFALSSGKQKWVLEDNIHHSYFNVDGDMTEELPKGTVIRLNNANYNVQISMFSDGHTFIQLDKEHNAEPGDFFTVVADESDLGLSDGDRGTADKSVDLDDGDDDFEADEKPVEVKVKTPEGEFSEDIALSENVAPEDVLEELKAKKMPGLVIVTQPWCGACKNLKSQVSRSESAKKLMEKFVVVHAPEEAGADWQAEGEDEGYIPRVYFLGKDGNMFDIQGPNKDHSHFFPGSDHLEKAMKKALLMDSESHASDEL